MKQGESLIDLASKVQAQLESKKDYIVPTSKMEMRYADERLQLIFNNENETNRLMINNHAHGQIAARLQIPKKYYDRMLEDQPLLLCQNVNTWFNSEVENRMVRTLDGNVRAFLSDGYRRLDNYDLLTKVLPALREMDMQIHSCNLSEANLYLKVIFNELNTTNAKGEKVFSGITLSNSEVGSGSVKIEPMTWVEWCSNGAVWDKSLNKYHTGRRSNVIDDNSYELFSDATKQLTDDAFWNQVLDVVKASMDEVRFNNQIALIDRAIETPMKSKAHDEIKLLQKSAGFTDNDADNILQHLIMGGDLSTWGLSQAVTRAAQDIDLYEEATQMERLGGQILIALDPEWNKVSEFQV
jgi:hypothetical protein